MGSKKPRKLENIWLSFIEIRFLVRFCGGYPLCFAKCLPYLKLGSDGNFLARSEHMTAKKLIVIMLLLFATHAQAWSKHQSLSWVASHTPTDTALAHHELLAKLYFDNQYQPIWYQYDAIQAFEAQLEYAALADISDAFYQRLLELKEARYQNRWQEYDILATDTLLTFISYSELAASKGKGWFFGGRVPAYLPPPSEAATSALLFAVQNDQLQSLVLQLEPDSAEYHHYLLAIEQLKPYVNFYLSDYRQSKRFARRGDRLSHKVELVYRLEVLGYDVSQVDRNNRTFDRSLDNVVREFQQRHGLGVDGVIGPKTIYWLNRPIEERLRLVALNAQRLRIWPTQRNQIILVNVPQFAMAYWRDGERAFESDVIVGRPSRKTPLIDTRMDSVILNPRWNVPRKIMVKDILPKVFRSSDYLTEHNYEIVKSWSNREVVNPIEIDWSTITPNSFPYRIRQLSGPQNALGRYKFNTPNKNAIFLHDTPTKSLFAKERRAFSSGCIRVEQAENLALLLLEQSAAQPFKQMSLPSEETVAVTLKRRIPVHIIYQTVWIDSGKVQYRSDVYRYDYLSKSSNFDAKLTKIVNLDKVLSAQ